MGMHMQGMGMWPEQSWATYIQNGQSSRFSKTWACTCKAWACGLHEQSWVHTLTVWASGCLLLPSYVLLLLHSSIKNKIIIVITQKGLY